VPVHHGDSVLYTPILQTRESGCIRVLDVQAATSANGLDEPIRSELRIIDLMAEPRPRFSALSYVWGNPGTEECAILCGAHSISILPSGHSALKYLRKKLGRFTIWIDAICINQNDGKEKENQIPLMGDIYSKAETTYVWLGEGSPKIQRAIAYLQNPRFLKHHDLGDMMETGVQRPKPWMGTWVFLWEGFKLRQALNSPPGQCKIAHKTLIIC